MNALNEMLHLFDYYDPELAREARRELEILASGEKRDPSALVSVRGVKQPLVEEGYLISGIAGTQAVPVVVVEKVVAPSQELLTVRATEQPE